MIVWPPQAIAPLIQAALVTQVHTLRGRWIPHLFVSTEPHQRKFFRPRPRPRRHRHRPGSPCSAPSLPRSGRHWRMHGYVFPGLVAARGCLCCQEMSATVPTFVSPCAVVGLRRLSGPCVFVKRCPRLLFKYVNVASTKIKVSVLM
jgi:hypothetical protein